MCSGIALVTADEIAFLLKRFRAERNARLLHPLQLVVSFTRHARRILTCPATPFFLQGSMELSRITVASLADGGYIVDASKVNER